MTFQFQGQPLPNPFPGEYQFVRQIGSGAFGQVWEARDLNLDITVALKTILFSRPDPKAEHALERLRSEAKLVASVRHPNVVLVRTWRETDTRDVEHYLVMDFVRGGSLLDVIQASGPLPWERAVRYAADIGEALSAVHKRGIVHRDVKPANILWDSAADEARLTDFGISARFADHLAGVAGSLPYMAPEAFQGSVEPPVDVYALSATLYRLVTGEVPFVADKDGNHIAEVRRGLPLIDPRLAGVPVAVEQLIRDGLNHDTATRPVLTKFVEDLRGELNRSLADTVVKIDAAPPGAPAVIGPVRIAVERFDGRGYQPVAASFHAAPQLATRDMKKVPPTPRTAEVRTGDRVRIRVTLDQDGYLTVFNIGPTGNLNLLYPDDPSGPQQRLAAGRPVDVCEVKFEPPAGKERVFAFWSRDPLPLGTDDLRSLAADPLAPMTRAHTATRDMKKVQTSLRNLPASEWHAVGLELDHQGR